VNHAVQAGSDAVTDTGSNRTAHLCASFATRHPNDDGSDAGRHGRSAGTTSHAAGPTADDYAHGASN
jgi:hypothetical protein